MRNREKDLTHVPGVGQPLFAREDLCGDANFVLAVGFFSLILWFVPAYAGPVASDHEIEVAAGFFHAQGSSTGALNADLGYGYYLTPGWEIGFRQALNYTFVDRARDAWFATTTPFLNYNFRLTDTIVPFLGASFGVVWNDQDVTGTLGPQVGIKFVRAASNHVAPLLSETVPQRSYD